MTGSRLAINRMGELTDLSPLQIERCAALIGPDARSPELLAVRYGVSAHAIRVGRRRAEKKLGVLFRRPHRLGRPIQATSKQSIMPPKLSGSFR